MPFNSQAERGALASALARVKSGMATAVPRAPFGMAYADHPNAIAPDMDQFKASLAEFLAAARESIPDSDQRFGSDPAGFNALAPFVPSLPTEAKRAETRGRIAEDLAYSTPGLGNVLSARDAYTLGGGAVEAARRGEPWSAAGQAGLSGLAALGAVSLPWAGRLAKGMRGAAGMGGGPLTKAGGEAVGMARGAFEIEIFPGNPVRILQNPTDRELHGFISRTPSKAVRVLDDPATGERYVWDAHASALHGQVARLLGIEHDISGQNAGKIMTLD